VLGASRRLGLVVLDSLQRMIFCHGAPLYEEEVSGGSEAAECGRTPLKGCDPSRPLVAGPPGDIDKLAGHRLNCNLPSKQRVAGSSPARRTFCRSARLTSSGRKDGGDV
jgi:hypothetical protein